MKFTAADVGTHYFICSVGDHCENGQKIAITVEENGVVGGTLAVQSAAGKLHVTGFLTGLEPGQTGGWHVHTGFSCDDASEVGGHYYDTSTPGAVDPVELARVVVGGRGRRRGAELPEPGFTLRDEMPVADARSWSTTRAAPGRAAA